MNPVSSEVSLSVVLQAGGQRERAGDCLTSLLKQSVIDEMQILVLDYGLGSHPPLPGSDHPAVEIIRRDEYEPFSHSRAIGVKRARAPVVAFVEDHVVVFDGWAEAILESHQAGWKAIGPEVHSGNPGVGISDAIALMNNATWRPPAEEGVHELLAGHNTAYDREVLLSMQPSVEVLLRCDPVLQWLLRDQGHPCYLNPRSKIAHLNETELSGITAGYFHWNCLFAATRAQVFDWPWHRRALRILTAPLVPPVRVLRQYVDIRQNHPDRLGRYLESLPVQLVAHSVAALGQVLGFLFGEGQSDEAFLRYELNQVRRTQGKDAGGG